MLAPLLEDRKRREEDALATASRIVGRAEVMAGLREPASDADENKSLEAAQANADASSDGADDAAPAEGAPDEAGDTKGAEVDAVDAIADLAGFKRPGRRCLLYHRVGFDVSTRGLIRLSRPFRARRVSKAAKTRLKTLLRSLAPKKTRILRLKRTRRISRGARCARDVRQSADAKTADLPVGR